MRIVVQGGQPLQGTFRASGNSNSAIGLIAASLLTDQPVLLRSVPDTLSTAAMLDAAQVLGTTVERADHGLTLTTPALHTRAMEHDLTEAQVSTVLFLAAILARRQHARMEVAYPLSRLHTHLAALRDLGVTVHINGGVVDFEVVPWESREIMLMQASVTATALVCMLAASLGGSTVITNAASEPHIQDLQQMLVAMGARIEGIGSNTVRIFGSKALMGTDVSVSPDHIEIASYAAMGAITHGSLTIEGVNPAHLSMITRTYARLGIKMFVSGDSLFVPVHEALEVSQREDELDVPIETAPWPGFPSDLVAMATVIATQARGTTLIHEKLFPNRLLFVDKLTSMGGQIVLCDPHRAIVVGPSRLRGEYLDTPDIRTGLALLGAVLCSESQVVIDNAELIARTFENVLERLINLGAKIEMVQS